MTGNDLYIVERDEGVVVLRIECPKANSMSPQMLTGLRDSINAVRGSDASALVITGHERSFCAGLALPQIVDFDRDQLRDYMQLFNMAMIDVLTLPIPTVAAINGHAIAGGCVLALMCDYRVMSRSGGRIGLNETKLGMGLPSVVIEPLRARVPARSIAPIAIAGELFEADDALGLELVDDVVEPDELISQAVERAQALSGPAEAVAQVKAALIEPTVAAIEHRQAAEYERWLDTWFSEDGQQIVRDLVSGLGTSS